MTDEPRRLAELLAGITARLLRHQAGCASRDPVRRAAARAELDAIRPDPDEEPE